MSLNCPFSFSALVGCVLVVRTDETIEVTDRPEVDHAATPAVEERWASSSRHYAVEHTRLESFDVGL